MKTEKIVTNPLMGAEVEYQEGPDGMMYPQIEYPEQPTEPLTLYGQMRLDYLKEYKPVEYLEMMMSGTLLSHCLKIQHEVEDRLLNDLGPMCEAAGATEELKARDMMQWVGIVSMTKAQLEEIIRNELIYT